MDIYVIRWAKRIDGEEECGNFDYCYTEEAPAREAMLRDFNLTKKDWERDVEAKNQDRFENDREELRSRTLCDDEGREDYCEITVEGGGTYDYHEWYIDKLGLETT